MPEDLYSENIIQTTFSERITSGSERSIKKRHPGRG
jgi:hypothetical protein